MSDYQDALAMGLEEDYSCMYNAEFSDGVKYEQIVPIDIKGKFENGKIIEAIKPVEVEIVKK